MLRVTADRSAAATAHVRGGIDQTDEQGDKGSADLLTGIVHMLDQSLYFLEAHLQM